VEQPRQVGDLDQFLTADRAHTKVSLHRETLAQVECTKDIRTDGTRFPAPHRPVTPCSCPILLRIASTPMAVVRFTIITSEEDAEPTGGRGRIEP
jgi:hypothetical protein